MSIRQLTEEYCIDLTEPEDERWDEVIEKERNIAKELVEGASRDFMGYDPESSPKMRRAMAFLAQGYRFSGGHYQGELKTWAQALDVSPALMTFLNCQYELSHLIERGGAMAEDLPVWMKKLLRLGCTAGTVRLGSTRAVHVRNMDWPIKRMGSATRIFRFVEGEREFVSVGVPGMVGALSGMVPGAYSATIDYAPPTFMPGFDFGPLFLLRHVFETCDTYEEACYALSHTKLSSNVLFMVCSANGKARVIERTRKAFASRPMRGGVLTVANHFQSGKLSPQNAGWDPDIIADSIERTKTLKEALLKHGARATLAEVATALEGEPITNDETRQTMVFDPSRGELLVWSR